MFALADWLCLAVHQYFMSQMSFLALNLCSQIRVQSCQFAKLPMKSGKGLVHEEIHTSATHIETAHDVTYTEQHTH